MFHIILVAPEIPPNTGNVIRLAANTGCQLHLVEPLGFRLDNSKLKRAGLDYHEWARVQTHPHLAQALAATNSPVQRRFALTTKGQHCFNQIAFQANDVFVFGNETAGLNDAALALLPAEQRLCLPMRPQQRSLNLSNAVAVTVFEAWRQLDYAGAATGVSPNPLGA